MTKPSLTLQLNASRHEDIERAIMILRAGGLVALPTETVYGLAANALRSDAIKKIFIAKNRPLNNPLIVHTHSVNAARELYAPLSRKTEHRFLRLTQAFWPGPLTIVAQKAAHIPDEASGGLDTVAVRIPRQVACLSVLSALDFPLVMPSANISTRPSPTKKEHVIKTLDGRIDAVLDDGVCDVGIESTVVRIDQEKVTLLRLGHIDKKALTQVLGEDVEYAFHSQDSPICPGQSYLHYAPAVKQVSLGNEKQLSDAWHSSTTLLGTKSALATLVNLKGPRSSGLTLTLSDTPQDFAAELYDALYRSENTPDQAMLMMVPQGEEWQAINDRLIRAAGLSHL